MARHETYDAIEQLAQARDRGEISEEIFARRKAELLASLETPSGGKGSLTWNGFLASLKNANAAQQLQVYQDKFRNLINKGGLGDTPIDDKASHSKLSRTTSWNWVGFLFSIHWFAYRGIYGWPLIVGLYGLLVILSAYVPKLDAAASFGFCLVGGLYGNAMLLYTLARLRNLNGASGLVEIKPSWGRVGISLSVMFIALFIFFMLNGENRSLLKEMIGGAGIEKSLDAATATAEVATPSPAVEPQLASHDNAEGANDYSATYTACMNSGDAAQGITSALVDCLDAERRLQFEQLDMVYSNLLNEKEPEERPAIVEAQRLWAAFRDSKCASENQTGGTQDAIGRASCLLEAARIRIGDLQRMR